MSKDVYGFEKPKKSSKLLIVVEIIIIALCAITVVSILTLFFMFSKAGAAPKIFGEYMFLYTGTNMGSTIPQNTAVHARDDTAMFTAGNDTVAQAAQDAVVLCRVESGTVSEKAVLQITATEIAEDGSVYFILKSKAAGDNETIRLPKENVIAQCMTFDRTAGAILSFATSRTGIITVVIVPCVLLIIFQIIRIIRLKMTDDDEYEDDERYATDKVVFSTLKEDGRRKSRNDDEETYEPIDYTPKPQAQLPVREQRPARNDERLSFDNSSITADRAQREYAAQRYSQNMQSDYEQPKKPAPKNNEELLKSLMGTGSVPQARTQPAPLRQSETAGAEVSGNFTRKPVYEERKPEIAREFTSHPSAPSYDTEPARKIQFEEKTERNETVEEYKLRYERERGVTIPTDAVMPKETIAPPPKQSTNKTVEEIMRMIDGASGK